MTAAMELLHPASCLLLLLLFLLTGPGVTSADNNGPVKVKEGDDVVLPCSLRQTDLNYEIFDWKKDDQKEVFLYDSGIHYNNGRGGQDPQFKGRVSHFEDELQHGNASIKIRNTKLEDRGNYSCIFPRLQNQIFHIELVVGASPKLYVTNRDQTADRALLECAVQRAFPKPTVQWKNRAGKVLSSDVTHESTTTSKDNKDIKLFDITLQTYVTQTGRYSCVVTLDKIHHQVFSTTFVRLGAALKPFVSRLDQKKDQALLQCEVHGASSKPVVQWRDSSGNVVPAKEPRVTEREGSYDIILQTTVTKTDSYRCVSTQDEINHQVHAETYVSISGSESPGRFIAIGGGIGGGIGGVIGGVIAFVALKISPVLRKRLLGGSTRSNAVSKGNDEDVPLPTNGSSDNRVVVKEGSDAVHVL